MSTTTKYRHCERRRREAIQCGAGKCMESLYLCRYDSLDRHSPAGFAMTEMEDEHNDKIPSLRTPQA